MSKKYRRSLNDDIHGDRAEIAWNKRSFEWEDELPSTTEYFAAGKSSRGAVLSPRCYNSHKPMPLPGTTFVIHGGSCSNPVVTDADVYIGFDPSMKQTSRRWPWTVGDEVYFNIPDMCAPTNAEDFRKLVDWTKVQLEAGRKVHAGCIGGHGRTGTFFAALVSLFGEPDAVTYVRAKYCPKAVESASQIKFLGEHYGVKAVKGYKDHVAVRTSPDKKPSAYKSSVIALPKQLDTFSPLPGRGCIWG